ncbi:MAG: alkaline phosphatase family protein [Sphingobacteriales bacterium]|nr:alkaline phosphatase family protein [Sphingobacteriales bacterium]
MKFVSVAIAIIFVINCSAQKTPSAVTKLSRPKLVVGVVIDQMRWDYLYRYYNRYGNDGFKRLLNQGFSCDNTMIPYTPTVTGAGHACIYTGSVPAIHGIVANDWVERSNESLMYCSRDTSVRGLGTTASNWAGQMSPKNMLTNTMGDELKLATNFRSKVIGISLKDRGGILPAGHSANAAYWFDDLTGNWISSTYYFSDIPDWVKKYNALRKQDSLMKNDWTLLYPQPSYIQSTEDDKAYEKLLESDGKRTFPHKYQSVIGSNDYNAFRASPFGATYTFDFAKETVSKENLGMGAETDMLCVSISTSDYLGHRFGPNSLEQEDAYLRLDKDLADFLNYLDKTLGKNNYLLFLSADHGSPQTAGYLKEKKYTTAGTLNNNDIVVDMNKLCKQKFGADTLVKKIFDYQLYIDMHRVDSLKLNHKEVKTFLVNYLKSLNEVWNAYDVDDFSTVTLPPKLKERLANSYYYRRSGDIQFFYKAQYTDYTTTGLEHGAWYPYDTHIPLLFYGWNIKPGRLTREVYMTDIAPTISAMLKIQMPSGCIGKVIEEVIK